MAVTKERLAFGGRLSQHRLSRLPTSSGGYCEVEGVQEHGKDRISGVQTGRGRPSLFGRNRKHEFADRRVDERIG